MGLLDYIYNIIADIVYKKISKKIEEDIQIEQDRFKTFIFDKEKYVNNFLSNINSSMDNIYSKINDIKKFDTEHFQKEITNDLDGIKKVISDLNNDLTQIQKNVENQVSAAKNDIDSKISQLDKSVENKLLELLTEIDELEKGINNKIDNNLNISKKYVDAQIDNVLEKIHSDLSKSKSDIGNLLTKISINKI